MRRKKKRPAVRVRTEDKQSSKASLPASTSHSSNQPISIVGIGASAGGLEAFEELLAALPVDSGLAFVLVQHLAPKHESILSELLGRSTMMPVVEVKDGVRVQPNRVYVIPPNVEMSISKGVLHLTPLTPDRAHRMSIDLFLRSLAEDQESRAIGVILSGTASDGTVGLRAIKAMGGITFAQDDSAKYNAMPRSAIAAGNVDFVLAPGQIAHELDRIAKHIHIFAREDHVPLPEAAPSDEALDNIFGLLRNLSRVDFKNYKPGTIKRRITRRMFLRKIEGLQAYVQYLRKNPEEVEILFNDLLINVTGFFRDPEAFDILRKQGFGRVLKNKGIDGPIRIWVPGCSTGEEAYSLAIELLEYLGENADATRIQIFATDVSEAIIQKARDGIYPESIAMDMTATRLRRYFQRVDSSYQISKSIRDMCIFARQDIGKDPPFSKLDMISCRNVMIYMGQVLQKKIIPVFHYALNEGGLLFLGSSETVGSFGDLFDPIDKKHRLYSRKSVPGPVHFEFVPRPKTVDEPRSRSTEPSSRVYLQKLADQVLMNRYAPAGVMVNEKLDIVQFIGQSGRFLDPVPGDATLSLLRMVREGLQMELGFAFQKVKRDGRARKEGVHIEHGGGMKTINLEIIPVQNVPGKEHYYLVVFEDVPRPEPKAAKSAKKEKPEKRSAKTKMPKVELENTRLKEELEGTRDYLQSIIEEQRATNEELQSANEEIQSSNEELQSINEELETAKEELQSTNEELTTVNEELQNRNDELTQLNNDLNNLLSSVNIPIVMLSNDLRIRRFTPMAAKVMNLIPADVGRPVTDIKPNLKITDLRQMISRVIDSLEIHENEVEDNTGRWYSMRIRPYRTIDNKIDGAVIVLLDLDARLNPKQL